MRRRISKFAPVVQIAFVCAVWIVVALLLPMRERGVARGHATTVPGRTIGPRFVFADLDGDFCPDFAFVELHTGQSANSYSIRFKMSSGLGLAIGVEAPMGGLRLTARDVNGDKIPDLVVTSNLDIHFIEILLNDGRGNFSVAPAGDFSGLSLGWEMAFQVPAARRNDPTALTVSQNDFDRKPLWKAGHRPRSSSGKCFVVVAEAPIAGAAMPRRGRAPPVALLHFS